MLFRPLRIGPVTLSGRLMRSATLERVGDETGRPGPALTAITLALAKGECPCIVTGGAFVQLNGRSTANQTGIHSDELIAPWRLALTPLRRECPQTKVFLQIVHGGRQVSPACVPEPIAPSAAPSTSEEAKPREMTRREIEETLDAFGEAARRARAAGFDGVQLHCAHGFLLSQFLSPYLNRRMDEWGGTPERRRRFVLETLRRVRAQAGPEMAVTVKINAEDFVQDGLSLAESCEAARALAAEGIDAIEVSAWNRDASERLSPVRKGNPRVQEEGYFLSQTLEIKRAAGATPVGACGGFRSLSVMRRAVGADGLDFVAASRPFICEPDLARRLQRGQKRATCISCNACYGAADAPVHCPLVADGRLRLPPIPEKPPVS